jgi:protein involved in polysaccharide export with SLBB domain
MKTYTNYSHIWFLLRPMESRQRRNSISRLLSSFIPLWMLLTIFASSRLFAHDEPSSPLSEASPSASILSTNTDVKPSATASHAAAANATGGMNLLDDKHKLAIHDQISFRIIEDEDDPKTLTVTDSGELEIPYIGRFMAVGRTCKELAGQLKTELEKDYYKRATVIIAVNVMATSRGRVYIVGPVHSPGPQEIPSDETLTLGKAILRAGGFTEFADTKKVKVTRQSKTRDGKDQVFIVNEGKVLDNGGTESDLPLEPGDMILIQEKLVRF